MESDKIKNKDKFINTLYEKLKDIWNQTDINDCYYINPYNYANHNLVDSIINWMDNYKD